MVLLSWLRTIVITALMAGAVIWADALLSPASSIAGTWRWAVIQLGVLVSIGGIVVWAASLALQMPERRWAIGRTSPADRTGQP